MAASFAYTILLCSNYTIYHHLQIALEMFKHIFSHTLTYFYISLTNPNSVTCSWHFCGQVTI